VAYCHDECADAHWQQGHYEQCNYALIAAPKRDRSVDVFELTQNGDVEGLREAYLSGAAAVNDRDKYGATALILASAYNQDNVVAFLLQAPSIDVNAKRRDGLTALMFAAEEGYGKIARMLLEHPTIDVNAGYKEKWTALHYAAYWNGETSSNEVVQMLLNHPKIDINRQEHKGLTALHLACRYAYETSSVETVALLLQAYKINVNALTNSGKTALMMAVKGMNESGKSDVVRMLLSDPRVNPTLVNNKGMTAMDICENMSCKLFIYSLVIAKKRIGNPQIPVGVARIILARKIQLEICQGLVEGSTKDLLELASLLQVPPPMIVELKSQSREEICTFVSDVIAIGAVWDDDSYARRQRQRKAQVAQGYFNKLREYMRKEFDEDITWMSVKELQDKLSALVNL